MPELGGLVFLQGDIQHAVLLRCPGARTTSLRRPRCESAWTRPCAGRRGTVACCVSCALRERSVDSSCATEERVCFRVRVFLPGSSAGLRPQACESLAERSRVRMKVAHEHGFICKVPIVEKQKQGERSCYAPVNCNFAAWTLLELSCPETGLHKNGIGVVTVPFCTVA